MGALPAGGGDGRGAGHRAGGRWSRSPGRGVRSALAAVNGPRAVVISGDEDAVLELAGLWAERDARPSGCGSVTRFIRRGWTRCWRSSREVAERCVVFSSRAIPIVSNVTGEPASAEESARPEYWVRHVREPVRFSDGVRWLEAQGVRSFLELGPDGVLSAMVLNCLGEQDVQEPYRDGVIADVDGTAAVDDGVDASDRGPVVAVPLLRGGRPEIEVLIGSLGEALDTRDRGRLERALRRCGRSQGQAPHLCLSARALLAAARAGAGDVTSIGQASADHPLLGALVALADDQGWLFTGRLSLESYPWLADHAVMGTVLLPGTAFLELALHAGGRSGVRRCWS